MKNMAVNNGKNFYSTNESYASNNTGKTTCIFLSHISTDKEAVEKIASYIMAAGYNVYLDIHDKELQQAVATDNAGYITSCIDNGINKSSHVLCFITENTKRSWWVPYEVGYGKKGGKSIATLSMKDVSNIPEFLKVVENLEGIISLNKYLNKLKTGSPIYEVMNESFSSYHPLSNYLNPNK
jgi:hypothetical protein